MAVLVTSAAMTGLIIAWTRAQIAKLHIIGWRVIANTPRGSAICVTGLPGAGKAGLLRNDPTSRTDAIHMSAVATPHSHSGRAHRSSGASAFAPP